jgi:hypothetical protein
MDALLFFNGINGASGAYDVAPISGEGLAKLIQGQPDPENIADLKKRKEQKSARVLGVREGVDPLDLAQAGWGVIFPTESDPAIREALQPLLALRQSQAGERFHIYAGAEGYQPGQAKSAFLARRGVGPGPAEPEKVPYYLLLVGSPEQIPYHFQYQLDVQYAVGRLWFETPAEYDAYARSVVTAEGEKFHLPRRAALWGVENADDPATRQSLHNLIHPLLEKLPGRNPGWQFESSLGADATKTQLSALMGGSQTPALLFTASHGMSFPLRDARQVPHQGALLCQDWPGPREWQKAIPQDFYLAGDDLPSDASLLGLVSFHYACYGAGAPQLDEFARLSGMAQRAQVAPHAMLAGLPTRLLGHPRGGALAVIGHIDRAWGYSFNWASAGAQTAVFESAIQRILNGAPVGYALEYFNERYAELSSDLSMELEALDYGKKVNPLDLAALWTANNDARSYVVLGDPAVRLAIGADATLEMERPAIRLMDATFSVPISTPEPVPAQTGLLSAFVEDELVTEFSVNAAGTSPAETLSHQLEIFLADETLPAELRAQASQLLEALRAFLDQSETR